MGFQLDDYVTVAERIELFRKQYPNGSLQAEWQIVTVTIPKAVKKSDGTWENQPIETPMIVAKAYAYRTPDDPRPGIGHAQEAIPGKTPYTKDSELMNAETSAWGRAIIAVLAADTKRGVASRDEVQARQ